MAFLFVATMATNAQNTKKDVKTSKAKTEKVYNGPNHCCKNDKDCLNEKKEACCKEKTCCPKNHKCCCKGTKKEVKTCSKHIGHKTCSKE